MYKEVFRNRTFSKGQKQSCPRGVGGKRFLPAAPLPSCLPDHVSQKEHQVPLLLIPSWLCTWHSLTLAKNRPADANTSTKRGENHFWNQIWSKIPFVKKKSERKIWFFIASNCQIMHVAIQHRIWRGDLIFFLRQRFLWFSIFSYFLFH